MTENEMKRDSGDGGNGRYRLELVGLAPAGNRKFGGYSKGMKRRLTVAAIAM